MQHIRKYGHKKGKPRELPSLHSNGNVALALPFLQLLLSFQFGIHVTDPLLGILG